ncbi:YkgJ family cysteine cluster protein [Chloroflexota bacterium]
MTCPGIAEGKQQVPPFAICFRCGICCSDYQAILSVAEGQCIADKLGLTPYEFQNRYVDKNWPGIKNFLLRKRNGACVFLERVEGSKVTHCRIHAFRPSSCSAWVPGLNRRECQAGLARYWGLGVSPTGSVEGAPEKVREFCDLLETLATCYD